jgi:flagellar motor switch/type III secretory pathway protein FliN
MTTAAIEGLTALRLVDPGDDALGSVLCATLRHAGLQVRVVAVGHETPWFAASEGMHFHIAAIGGHAVSLSADRISDAVAALDAVDPILIAIEGALGVSMDADAMVGAALDDAIVVSLTNGDETIHLAVPRDHGRQEDWVQRAALLPPREAHMPCIVRIDAQGPRLSVAEASNLSDGDLVLIPNRAAAALIRPYADPIPGMIDLTTGHFNAGQTGASMPEDNPDFLVPLTIRLPDRMTSVASLASLEVGTTLPLGSLTEGMPVELRVADRLLACGELVQMGDRFAVLIESRADIADPVSGEAE